MKAFLSRFWRHQKAPFLPPFLIVGRGLSIKNLAFYTRISLTNYFRNKTIHRIIRNTVLITKTMHRNIITNNFFTKSSMYTSPVICITNNSITNCVYKNIDGVNKRRYKKTSKTILEVQFYGREQGTKNREAEYLCL